MSLFKEKKSKNFSPIKNKRYTIDAKHQEKIKYFQNLNKKVPELKKKLTDLNSEYDEINSIPKCKLTDDQFERYFNLKDEICKIQKEIDEITSNQQQNEYFLKTSYLMHQYYDKFKNNINYGTNLNYNKLNNNKTVLHFLHDNKKDQLNTIQKPETIVESKQNIPSKSDIINNYLKHVENDFLYPFDKNDQIEYCQFCKKEKYIIASEAISICTSCGRQNYVIIDSDKPSYKDPPREICYFAYKRINHFNEWLAQFQAKESTDIPQVVFDKILVEIKKERIENMALLTSSKLREILKKLKLNKYYEHVPHIINRLNGLPAPVMNRNTEEKLRMMFKEIQTPFIKYCPKERKNFLSYSYVLHKFVQLLEMDEFLICFPLLKSREKLHQQDLIWKKICEELKWEFIKSL